MNPLPLVIGELRRHAPGATAIVTLVALASALGVVVSAQERGFRHAATRAADRFDLVVGAPGSPTQLLLTTIYLQPGALDLLPAQTLVQLQNDPRIAALAPIAVADSYRGHAVVGTSPHFAAEAGIAEGRLPHDAHEALAGSSVALPLGHVFAPTHGSAAQSLVAPDAHHHKFTVVGRLRASGTPWDRAIVVPIEASWAMHDERAGERASVDHADPLGPPWPAARVPAVVVKPRTVGDAYALRAAYRSAGTSALFPAEVLVPLYRLLGDARDVASAMAIAFEILLLLAILLGIIATLAARRGSIGVLRALGAPPRFVFATVWLEVAALVIAGVVLGALLGAIGVRIGAGFVSAQTGLAIDAALGAREALLLAAVALGGSLLGALPSLAALRGSVASLLRLA